MRYARYFVFLSIVLFSAGCSQEEDYVLSGFMPSEQSYLYPVDSLDLERLNVLMPEDIAKFERYLVIKKYSTQNHVDIVDTETGQVKHIIPRGRSDSEALNVGSFQLEDHNVLVYDVSQMKYLSYDLSSLEGGNEDISVTHYKFYETDSGIVSKPFSINKRGSLMVAVGLWEGDMWYRTMTQEGELRGGIGMVDFEELDGMTIAEKSSFHLSSHISISPSGDKVVCALTKAGAISVADVKDGKLTESRRRLYQSPKVESVGQKNMPLLAFSGESIRTFCDVYSSDERIAVLYSGLPLKSEDQPSYQCNYLLIYDWNLNPIKSYYLHNSVNSFWMEGNRLYGASSYPKSSVYIYEL